MPISRLEPQPKDRIMNEDDILRYMQVIAEAIADQAEEDNLQDMNVIINALNNVIIKMCRFADRDPALVFEKTLKGLKELDDKKVSKMFEGIDLEFE